MYCLKSFVKENNCELIVGPFLFLLFFLKPMRMLMVLGLVKYFNLINLSIIVQYHQEYSLPRFLLNSKKEE